jgi:hypothetical protein
VTQRVEHLVPTIDDAPAGDDRRPAAWTSTDTRSFAWSVLHERHPVLVDTARAAHPYGHRQADALTRLVEESTAGELLPLPPDRHDAAAWSAWTSAWVGRRWDAAPFLGAESYFYRRLLDAVDFFRPGPWFWLDPFAHQKDAELADPALVEALGALDGLPSLPRTERAATLITDAVWGNKADLGFAAHQHGTGSAAAAGPDSVLVDQTEGLLAALTAAGGGTVCFIADNAGRELLADLVLIDDLLAGGWADEVALHLKPTPYYVSDATTADLASCLRRLERAGGHAESVGRRLRDAFRTGRARVRTHWFYCAPLEFPAMPADLAGEIANCSTTILKGDLNYRRVFGDRHWPAPTPTQQAGGYFPNPFAVLRTLKSDVVLGLDETVADRLDTADAGWRTSGRHAVIQFVDPATAREPRR